MLRILRMNDDGREHEGPGPTDRLARLLAEMRGGGDPAREPADWPEALRAFEERLRADRERYTSGQREGGWAAGETLDIRASAMARAMLAEYGRDFEAFAARFRADAMRHVADALDHVLPGNSVAEALRADDPGLLEE